MKNTKQALKTAKWVAQHMDTVLAIPEAHWDELKKGKMPDFSTGWGWTPESKFVTVKVRDYVNELEKVYSIPRGVVE